jgi:uncharacterized protein with FMN-binding domain
MSSLQSKRPFKLTRRAKQIGVSAVLAATVAGYGLYEQSVSKANGLSLDAPITSANSESTLLPKPTATAIVTYQDGEYVGDSIRSSHWGNVQVKAIIENGQIKDIQILDYPHSRSFSNRISRVALPYLIQEAIQAQSAVVDIISGATPTSEAFMQSLQSALDDASNGNAVTNMNL